MSNDLPIEPLEVPAALPSGLPAILETLSEQTLEGGTLVSGPTAEANRDRLTELGVEVRELNERLLEILHEMLKLAGKA